MIGKLEFNLDDKYDRMAHARCCKATDAYLALLMINNSFDKDNGYTEVWETFKNAMEKYDIDLDRDLE